MIEQNPSQNIEKELVAITKQLLTESGELSQREIRLDDSLSRHLGIDSLGRAELFQRVGKKFNVRVPDSMFASIDTLNDIANYLRETHPTTAKIEKRDVITSHGERSKADPMQAKTLIDILLMYGELSPNKAHIYFQNEQGQEEIITYGSLLKSSLQVAQGLRERGLQEGETVAIMQPTNPGFFYTFLGTLLAGGVPVPIYPPFRAHMLEAYAKTEARILNSAEVRALVTFDKAEALSRLLQGFVPSLKTVTTVSELIKPEPLTKIFKAKSDNFAFIQYTSGSTADPKGVLLTHYNLLSNIRAYGKAIDINADSVAVSWLPLYHDMGLIGSWLGSLYHGIPLILLTPFTFLNRPETWLWTIHRHRGTHSGAPNFAYDLCVRKIEPALLEGLDLSSWRMAANGAEKVYPRTLEQFADKFAPYGFNRKALLPAYGLAESTVALTLPPLNREFRVDRVDRKKFEENREAVATQDKNALEFVSCGFPIEGHEVRIVDAENQVLPERHVGSVQFRGPSSMQGYYNNPRATQAVYHDGWLDSGDLAYQADGELFVTGRRKDLIIKAGRNLYPAEIEEIVGNIASVRQGCVTAFSVTDEKRSTEQLIVVAETREKKPSQPQQIIADIKEAISTTLDIVPDQVILVAPRTVPKTSSGKLQRAACKKMYLEGKLGKRRMPVWFQVTKLGAESFGHKSLNFLGLVGKAIYTAYVALITIITLLPLYFIVRFASRSFATKAVKGWAKIITTLAFCPIKIMGGSKLSKVKPAIYAPNHASYIDAIVMVAVVPPDTLFVGKKELFSAPIIRTFMSKLGHLGVDRIDLPKGLEDTRHIEQALKENHSILIFPEGTFGYASGLRPFRAGAFKIAAETNTPVYPIALQGTRMILRNDEKLMQPGVIRVTICDPISPTGTEWQDIIGLRNAVRAEIAKYCGEPSLDFIAAQTVAAPRIKERG